MSPSTTAPTATHDDPAVSRIESVLAGLKPIQDLAKNWDIDIASCLEEYLNDLVGEMVIDDDEQDLNVSSDSSVTSSKTNFAKAALVLHNSSHVYSRKVEYLHNLVLSALERMVKTNNSAQQQNKKASSKRRSAGANDDDAVDDFWEFDPHQEFLLLDDVLPVDTSPDGRHINLVTTPEEEELSRRLTLSGRDSHAGGTPSRLSLTQRTALGNTAATLNRSGSMAAPLDAAALLGTSATGSTSGELRLMNGVCELDPDTGRLILPGSQTRSVSSSVPLEGPRFSTEAPNANATTMDDDEPPVAEYAPDDYGGGDDDDDDKEGPGFVMNDSLQGHDETEDPTAETAHQRAKTTAIPPSFRLDKPDPWELVDPHQPCKSCPSSRPLKLGKTIRLPDDLLGKKTKKEPELPPAPRYIALETFKHLMDPENHPAPEIPWTGLIYGNELADVEQAVKARRQAERRKAKKKQEEEQAGVVPPSYVEDVDEEYAADDYDDGVDDDGYLGGADNGDVDDEAPDNNTPNVVETNTGFTSVEELYRPVDADETDSRAADSAFEALCRAHIAAFAKGAEKYAAATHLTQRVDQWQERLAPVLTAEEQRPPFDIFRYSHDVIDRLDRAVQQEQAQDDGALIRFSKVTEGRPLYDVYRLFLASLSLSNSGNVELVANQDKGDDVERLREIFVKLLCSDIERPMETFLAPSVAAMES